MSATHVHTHHRLNPPLPKHKTRYYTKIALLRALCMYSKHFGQHYQHFHARNELMRARLYHGQQFLIDLFVLSEVYMNHFPTFAMHKVRSDITWILNMLPDYRLKYEEN